MGTDGTVCKDIYRRYNAFHEQLFSKLEARGFLDLPEFPKKKFNPFMSEKDLNLRQRQLENYLRELISRKDTRNSTELIQFLELNAFAPETLYN